MAETTTGPGAKPDPTAAKNQGGEPIGASEGDTVQSGAGLDPRNEIERQAMAQLEADKAAGKLLAQQTAESAKKGRPTNAELDKRASDLQRAEREQAELIDAGRKAIEARKAQGQNKAVAPPEMPESEIGGVWARYVGNPRDRFDGPLYETMAGYTFEKDGDAVFVTGDPVVIRKFRGNDHFETEAVNLDDAAAIADGAVKELPRSDRTKRRIGKTG